MTRRLAPFLLLIGVLLAASSAVLGFSAIARAGATCGSAFRPDATSPGVQDYRNILAGQGVSTVQEQCNAAVGDRRTVALAVGVPGVLCLIIGAGMMVALSATREVTRPELAESH
jgi:hypothetical protein